MYTCEVCGIPSKPGAKRLIHSVRRQLTRVGHHGLESAGNQILREVPCCQVHKTMLDAGHDLNAMRQKCKQEQLAKLLRQTEMRVSQPVASQPTPYKPLPQPPIVNKAGVIHRYVPKPTVIEVAEEVQVSKRR